MDAATLRTDFPEFASTTAYPDSQVTFWLGVAAKLVSEERWGDLYSTGLELFAAHNLVLERRAAQSAGAGGVPGVTGGAIASKTVDKVTIAYDTTGATEADAGHWNLSDYGKRYIRLALLMGSGGRQF